MPANQQRSRAVFISRLLSIAALEEDDQAALMALPMQIVDLKAHEKIVREGDRPSRACVILDGFACSSKVTGQGRRQILSFHIAGDMPDLQGLHLRVLDCSIEALAHCRVGLLEHRHLQDLCERSPRIASALWRTTLIDGAIFREWVTNIGQRRAYSRMAHLVCELVVRLRAVGLAKDPEYDLPLTQTDFGDATGMSTVHVNRTLQELRRAGLISLDRGKLQVRGWEALKQVGDFDATYLHLVPEAETNGHRRPSSTAVPGRTQSDRLD